MKAELVITFKHHPIIFALGEGVPTLSISLDDYYLRKNSGAMANCGQECFCVDEEMFFSNKVDKVVLEGWRRRRELRDEILGNLDVMYAESSKTWHDVMDKLHLEDASQ